MREFDAEDSYEVLEIMGPSMRNRRRSYRIFKYKIPTHDPCEKLTQSCIRICVSRSGYGNHRCKFSVAKSGEDARQPGYNKRQHQRGACFIMCGLSNQHKNSSTYNCPNT